MLFYSEKRAKINNGLNAMHVTKRLFGRRRPINIIEKSFGSIYG